MDASGFTDYLVGEGLSPRSVSVYARKVAAADEWLQARGADLASASATAVGECVAASIPNSHSSRGQAAAAFKRYWEWVGRDRPPYRAVRVPPQPPMVCKALEDGPARDLVKAALGWHPQGTAVAAGLYLALRRTEIASMEWRRFDAAGDWYTVTGKRNKTATLPVHSILRAELAALPRPSRYLFPGRFGAHVAPATVWAWTKEVASAAGIDHLTTHWLRHTSLAIANDVSGDLRSVQTFARHSRPEQTAGYTRTTTRRLRGVSDALDYL